ncbi:MAG: hypothetical protein ACJAVK_002055 [Akkermansiaceae bacterium]|jgi:hypothetical protein
MKKLLLSLILSVHTLPGTAAIIIEHSPVTVSRADRHPDSFAFDVNNDGQTDWTLITNVSQTGSSIGLLPALTTGFVYQTPPPTTQPWVYPLLNGTEIGSTFVTTTYEWFLGYQAPLSSSTGQGEFGPFAGEEGYIGFQFEADDGIHFGYAYFISNNGGSITVSEYAWETEPGKAIRAGNIPEPSSALLMILSFGLSLTRRKRGK